MECVWLSVCQLLVVWMSCMWGIDGCTAGLTNQTETNRKTLYWSVTNDEWKKERVGCDLQLYPSGDWPGTLGWLEQLCQVPAERHMHTQKEKTQRGPWRGRRHHNIFVIWCVFNPYFFNNWSFTVARFHTKLHIFCVGDLCISGDPCPTKDDVVIAAYLFVFGNAHRALSTYFQAV